MPSKIFVDLETTGVSRQSDRIVEIAMILVDDDGNETEYRSLVNPQIPIPPGASKIHNIFDDDVKNAPTFGEILPEVKKWMEAANIFIAYNFNFDFGLLSEEFYRWTGKGLEEKDYIFYDPMKIFKHYFPHKLAVAYEHYTGKALVDAHSALADIKATKEVFEVQALRHTDLLAMDPKNDVIGAWFERDDKGRIVFTRGKHKGEEAKTLENYGYFKWLLALEDITDSEREYIKKCMVKK